MSQRSRSIALTYGGAAWLVILGVVAGWFYLKQNTVQANVDLPQIPQLAMLTSDPTAVDTPLQLAQVAYAAGRITRPQGDSALDYYRLQLAQNPDDAEALQGIKRVSAYLINGAETALRRDDWSSARELAHEARAISAENPAVLSILERINTHDRIAQLNDLARAQINNDKLTEPADDNALASYRSILALDPAHDGARQGIEMIAQRLASLAQTEAFADRTDRAHELIALARSIAPNAPGIEAAQQLTNEWTNLTNDQAVKEDVMAAAQAAQAGVLLTSDEPGQLGALELYQAALLKDPTSDAAQAGKEFVVQRVIDRIWMQLANSDFEQAERALAAITETGVDTTAVASELDFLKRRAGNRAGNFDERDYVAISQLQIKRRVQPQITSNIDGGTVELAFTVDENGAVSNVEVVAAGNPELGEAAVNAIERWKFAPYTWEGRQLPVRTGMIMRIET